MLDYIGTLPEAPAINGKTLSLNPQSRYQVTENIANQTEAIYKSYIGGWKKTTTGGVEFSREIASIDKYSGLSSESLPGGNPGGNIVGPASTIRNSPLRTLAPIRNGPACRPGSRSIPPAPI